MTRDLSSAHARRTDPATSHEAAQSIGETALTANRAAILAAVAMWGPITDGELVSLYGDRRAAHGWPVQSESGIRTRRSELTALGHVVSCGTTATAFGRRALRWVAV